MLVVLLNPWNYSGRLYKSRSLVRMPDELFNHIKEVSTGEMAFKQLETIFDDLISGKELSSELRAAIQLEESETEWSFRINHLTYYISKTTQERSIN